MSDIHKEAARLRGETRSTQVGVKVREAMTAIQKEMEDNKGIYPTNGGGVSMNEVARRAGISLTTLFSPKQKELGQIVKAWVESLKKTEVVGRTRVQRTLAQRSEDWRSLYLALQNTLIATELDLQDAELQLQNTQQSLAELSDKYNALREQFREDVSSKVIPIPKHKR